MPWVEFVWKVQSAKRRRLENKPSVPSTPSKKDRWIVLALVNNKNPYKLWVFSRFGDLIKVDFRLGRSWRSETRMVWSSSWAPGLKNDVSPESCGNSATSSRSVDVATLLQKPWRWCLHPKTSSLIFKGLTWWVGRLWAPHRNHHFRVVWSTSRCFALYFRLWESNRQKQPTDRFWWCFFKGR